MPDSALFLFDQESSMHFPIESKALRAGAHEVSKPPKIE